MPKLAINFDSVSSMQLKEEGSGVFVAVLYRNTDKPFKYSGKECSILYDKYVEYLEAKCYHAIVDLETVNENLSNVFK